MKSILKKLYYDNHSKDKDIHWNDSEYSQINDQTIELIKSLKEKLTGVDYNSISKLLDLCNEEGALEAANAFVDGFKYGMLITMEALTDVES